MGKRKFADGEGRAKCAESFLLFPFLTCDLSEAQFREAADKYVPPPFEAIRPDAEQGLNAALPGALAIPLGHFEEGLRLPLWPEVKRVLRHYGLVLAQLSPNSIAIIVALACYLRAEGIEFSIPVFQKLFTFRVLNGNAFFSGKPPLAVSGLANKHRDWARKFIFVKGDFGALPFSPVQEDVASFKAPALTGFDLKLYQFILEHGMDVVHLRLDLENFPEVKPGEGSRDLPVLPPHSAEITPAAALALAKEMAEADKELADLAAAGGSSRKRKAPPAPSRKSVAPASLKGKEKEREPSVEVLTPRHLAETSGTSLPQEHPNFSLGGRRLDSAGVPLISWDPEINRVSLSTLHPSWIEEETVGGEAYSVLYGLYGRQDAKTYHSATTKALAFETSRALLRAAELGHMASRRAVILSNNMADMEKSGDLAAAEISALKKGVRVSETVCVELRDQLEATTIEAAEWKEKFRASQAENKRLVESALLASSSEKSKKSYEEWEIQEMMQKSGRIACEMQLDILRKAGFLNKDKGELTVRMVQPWLYDPIAAPEDPAPSPLGDLGEDAESSSSEDQEYSPGC